MASGIGRFLPSFSASGFLGTLYNVVIYILYAVIIFAVVFFVYKFLIQYRYKATIFEELDNGVILVKRDRGRKKKIKGGGFEYVLLKERDSLPHTLVKEFSGKHIVVFKDRNKNYREIEFVDDGKITIKGTDKLYASYEIEKAFQDYDVKARWEKVMPIIAWGSVLVLNIIAWILISRTLKTICGGG